MQSIPTEVQSLILHHLNPASLNAAYQVCEYWKQTIQQDVFRQSYAQSRTTKDMKALTPEFLEKMLPHFSPQQLFYIDGKKITRHRVHVLAETDSNQLNSRIVQLLSSLDWYQEIVIKNKDLLIKQWHAKNPLRAQQFEESLQYIHLFLLGDSLPFIHNRADAISKEELAKLQNFKLLTKKDLNSVEFFEAMSNVEYLLSIDYATLKQVNTKILDDLFQEVFRRYHITHLMDPKDADRYLYLPNVFFKGLFGALSSQYLEQNTQHSREPEILSSETSWSFFDIPSLLFKYMSSFQTPSKADLTDEPLPVSAFKSLRISVNSGEKLEILRKWIETSQITIENLFLHIGFLLGDITIEGMKAFGEPLLRSNVKSIDFEGEHNDPNLINLVLKIKNSLH